MSDEFEVTIEVESSTACPFDQPLILKCKPHHTIESLKCRIYNILATLPEAADRKLHILRFNGAVIAQDRAKLCDFGIEDGSVLSVRLERECEPIQKNYAYEIMSNEAGGCSHIGLYTSFEKAHKAVLVIKGQPYLQINRIPLDTISNFDVSFDCIWEKSPVQ